MFSLLRAIDEHFSRLERFFLASTIIGASLLLFVNVVMRYVFHNAIYWAEEMVRYLMVWLIFVGGSQVVKQEGHISVDVMLLALPPRARSVANTVIEVIAVVFLLILGWYGFEQAMRSKVSMQVSPALELPMWLAYVAVPVGAWLMTIRYLQRLWNRIARARGPEDEKARFTWAVD